MNALRNPTLLLLAALALAGLACLPGAGGIFLFDDFPNLNGLAAVHADPGGYSLLQYAFTAQSSPLGRPLALLAFAAQAGSWDSRPADFIGLNILLHLLNGLLWFRAVSQLQRLGAIPPARGLPLLAAALWLFLPIHASTVLYVVQRMTLLATTCVLAGLVLYLSGRAQARPLAAWLRMGAGVALATGAGTLCKETAALTPLLLLVLEATLLRELPRPPFWRAGSALLLWAPALALLGYLAVLPRGDGTLGFTTGERLLTEGRVLFIYLAHALLPATSTRMFYDDLPLSTSLLSPASTALALAAWFALIAVAVARRRQWPVFAFALGWYLAGQLLESSVIPLEIAFDHRAYLPLLGVSLGLACGIAALDASARAQRLRPLLRASTVAYLGLLLACLWQSASLWGSPLAQAREWARRQPDSSRAVQHFGQLLVRAGQPAAARELYQAAAQRWPDDAVIALSWYGLGCFDPALAPPVAQVRSAIARHAGGDVARAGAQAQSLATRAADGQCPHHDPDEVLALVDTMLDSPHFAAMRLSLLHASALLLDATGRKALALQRVEQAASIDAQVPLLQQAVLWSLQLGDLPRAHANLRTLESAAITPRRRWTYRREIAGTRQLIDLYETVPGKP